MELWHWIAIGVGIFVVLAIVTKGRIFRIFGDIVEALID